MNDPIVGWDKYGGGGKNLVVLHRSINVLRQITGKSFRPFGMKRQIILKYERKDENPRSRLPLPRETNPPFCQASAPQTGSEKNEIGYQMNRRGLIAYTLAGFLFGRSAHY